jgi:hypothetical protein
VGDDDDFGPWLRRRRRNIAGLYDDTHVRRLPLDRLRIEQRLKVCAECFNGHLRADGVNLVRR